MTPFYFPPCFRAPDSIILLFLHFVYFFLFLFRGKEDEISSDLPPVSADGCGIAKPLNTNPVGIRGRLIIVNIKAFQ